MNQLYKIRIHVSGFTDLNKTFLEAILLTCCCFLCLQVDLGFLRYVSSIGTQGAISIETKKHYYVRSYKVDLSTNGEDWITVKEGSKQKAKINYFTVLIHCLDTCYCLWYLPWKGLYLSGLVVSLLP